MAKHKFTSRTRARKRAIDVVFEADQRGMGGDGRKLDDLLRERRVLTAAQTPLPEYSIELIDGVAHDLRRIDDLIEAHAKVSGLDRIPSVDLAAMRVAVWEMLHKVEDVPAPVAISEAVAIVKSVSTDTSPGFVNAVLDAVRKDIAAGGIATENVPSPVAPLSAGTGAAAGAPEPDDSAADVPAETGEPAADEAYEDAQDAADGAGDAGPRDAFDRVDHSVDLDALADDLPADPDSASALPGDSADEDDEDADLDELLDEY